MVRLGLSLILILLNLTSRSSAVSDVRCALSLARLLLSLLSLFTSIDSAKETPISLVELESEYNCEILEWEGAAHGACKHYHHAVSILCGIFRSCTMHSLWGGMRVMDVQKCTKQTNIHETSTHLWNDETVFLDNCTGLVLNANVLRRTTSSRNVGKISSYQVQLSRERETFIIFMSTEQLRNLYTSTRLCGARSGSPQLGNVDLQVASLRFATHENTNMYLFCWTVAVQTYERNHHSVLQLSWQCG